MPEEVHKIVFRGNGGNVTVSCRCRAVYGKHSRLKGGGDYHEPMPRVGRESVWETYNRPENHWAPFEEQDRIQI